MRKKTNEQAQGAADLVVKTEEKPKKQRSDIKGTGQGWRKGLPKVSADQILTGSKEYFSKCEDTDRKPTIEGLALHLGVCSDTLKRYLEADKPDSEDIHNTDVCQAIKKAVDYLSDDIQQRTDAMSIFRAKQKHYGGYTDRQNESGDGQISVNVVFGNNDGKGSENFGK